MELSHAIGQPQRKGPIPCGIGPARPHSGPRSALVFVRLASSTPARSIMRGTGRLLESAPDPIFVHPTVTNCLVLKTRPAVMKFQA